MEIFTNRTTNVDVLTGTYDVVTGCWMNILSTEKTDLLFEKTVKAIKEIFSVFEEITIGKIAQFRIQFSKVTKLQNGR